jgi:hypothetical protein
MSEPAATPAPEPAAADFASFEARENALAVGETPAPEPEKPSEPAPAPEPDDDEPEPAAEASPVAPAAPEKAVSKRQQHLNELERKAKLAELAQAKADLRAEELAAKLAAIEARTAPESKPEPTAIVDPADPEPQEAQFDDYRAFVKAQSRWEIRQAKREEAAEAEKASRATAERTAHESLTARVESWIERRDAFAAKTPGFTERAAAFLATLRTGTPIGDTILESDVGPELSDYLATHTDEADRIARLAPASALRALGKLEAQFDTPTHASAPAQPAGKTVTSAPAAPMTLSSRSAVTADPAAAALAAGDFEAWEREENRKAVQTGR